MKVADAESEILHQAVIKANQYAQENSHASGIYGDVFIQLVAPRAGGNPFALAFASGIYEQLLAKGGEPLVEQFEGYATQAVAEALKENPELFAGCILGYAHEGLDYFHDFTQTEELPLP